MTAPCESDEVLKADSLEETRIGILVRVRGKYARHRCRVHDAGGVHESSQRCAHPVRGVAWPRARHEDDREATRELRRLRIGGRRLSVRTSFEGPREETRVEPRDRDPEFIEGPLADPERPAGLDVVPSNSAAARDDEELDAGG